MGIHKPLRIIYREPPRAHATSKAPNAVFGGRSALDVMLGGEFSDLMGVRRHLDAVRARVVSDPATIPVVDVDRPRGDCQEFRVLAGMMEKKEISHGPTQRAPHP